MLFLLDNKGQVEEEANQLAVFEHDFIGLKDLPIPDSVKIGF